MIEQYENNLPNVLSLKERQVGYEKMFDKKQGRILIRQRFSLLIKDLNCDEKQKLILCDILGILALRPKKVSLNALIEMLAERVNLDKTEESVEDVIRCIHILYKADLVHVEIDEKSRFYVNGLFTLQKEDLDLLDQYQYKIPMIVKPLSLNHKKDNRGSGYFLNGTDSLILNVNHKYDIDHKVLERVNNIPLTINISLMKQFRNSWKNAGKSESVKINKDTEDNFKRYEQGVFNVSSILINNGNKFYLTHKYDKRGRVYSCGYHINYQSNSYAKAQLEFSNKELITDEIFFFDF